MSNKDNSTEQNTNNHSHEFNLNLSIDSMNWNQYLYNISIETVRLWLRDPIHYNKQIRFLSNQLYNSNGIYANVIDYMVSLPTLDRVIYSTDKAKSKFKNNKKKYNDVLKVLKDKIIVRDILHKLAVEGISFAYFETIESDPINEGFYSDTDLDNLDNRRWEFNANGSNCSVISFPSDFCRIVGIKNSSYVMAFDMSYFDQFASNGLSLKLRSFPKEIRDKYKVFYKDRSKRWAVLDNTKTIVNKIKSKRDERWGRPVGLAAFVDMLYDQYFLDSKRLALDENNSSIIFQTFPEGEKKGTSALTSKQQEQQHKNIRDALFSRSVRKGLNFFSIASGTKIEKIPVTLDILKTGTEKELLSRISSDLGFASSALSGENGNFASQQTNMQLVSAQIFTWLEQISDELNKVINTNVIKDDSCYMEIYYYPITNINRKDFVSQMKELYTLGKGSLQAWIAATGFNPDAYTSLMDFEIDEKYDERYTPHPTSFTMSDSLDQPNADGNGSAGRPVNSDTLNENTQQTRNNGSNQQPSPSRL